VPNGVSCCGSPHKLLDGGIHNERLTVGRLCCAGKVGRASINRRSQTLVLQPGNIDAISGLQY
jgi:hypothetical protein